jgi:hypothetical protein
MSDMRDPTDIPFFIHKIYCFTESSYFLKFYAPDLQFNCVFEAPFNLL